MDRASATLTECGYLVCLEGVGVGGGAGCGAADDDGTAAMLALGVPLVRGVAWIFCINADGIPSIACAGVLVIFLSVMVGCS